MFRESLSLINPTDLLLTGIPAVIVQRASTSLTPSRLAIFAFPGPDLRAANWAVAQGPPQLRGLHKKNSKKYYLMKHKNTF